MTPNCQSSALSHLVAQDQPEDDECDDNRSGKCLSAAPARLHFSIVAPSLAGVECENPPSITRSFPCCAMGRSGAASFKEDRASLLPQSGEVIDSLLPDDIDGGLERWVKTITIEGLEEAVAPNEILEAGAHFHESHVNARCVQFTVELFEHSRRRHVNVRHRLTLHDDPPGLAVMDNLSDLAAER